VLSELTNFASDLKSDRTYLDLAANAHGAEKCMLMHHALARIDNVGCFVETEILTDDSTRSSHRDTRRLNVVCVSL